MIVLAALLKTAFPIWPLWAWIGGIVSIVLTSLLAVIATDEDW